MTEKRHGKGLLFIVTLVLAAGVIKYADIPFAQTVREKAASALSGAANADHVLAVFGGSAMPADTVPAESSGGADDILDRDQTLFPDTVDQTVYPMEFEHATPTSGTLTSSFGSRLSPITGQPGFHYGLSYQLKNYLEDNQLQQNSTCMIYFSENRKKLEKEATKILNKYKKNNRMTVSRIDSDKFHFTKPEE